MSKLVAWAGPKLWRAVDVAYEKGAEARSSGCYRGELRLQKIGSLPSTDVPGHDCGTYGLMYCNHRRYEDRSGAGEGSEDLLYQRHPSSTFTSRN